MCVCIYTQIPALIERTELVCSVLGKKPTWSVWPFVGVFLDRAYRVESLISQFQGLRYQTPTSLIL